MTDNNEMWDEVDGMSDYEQKAKEASREASLKANDDKAEEFKNKIYEEKDLVKRARKLMAAQMIDWPHIKVITGGIEVPNPNSDANRYVFLETLFDHCSGRCPHPYFDTFRALPLDHEGEEINERNSHASVLVRAMDAAGLQMQSFEKAEKTYLRIAYSVKRNSLLEYFEEKSYSWDGEPRMESFLIDLFRLRDTKLNRMVGRYFWMSLFNRITNPGCYAPLSIALIGAQDVGKSFFSVMLCRTLTGYAAAAPADLNLADIERNLNDWLRKITGHSVIANIGEMRGYKKADIETFKSFTTRTVDNMNQKYGSPIDVPRQWIIVADSNSYDGFNRDESGNRRFYPFFVNQGPDLDGQPHWPSAKEDSFRVDYHGFEDVVWQIMSECREEMSSIGEKGYIDYTGEVSRGVFMFNADEMEQGRGIIRDDTMDNAVREIMLAVPIMEAQGKKWHGFFIKNQEFQSVWNRTQRGTINNQSMIRIMRAMNWRKENLGGVFGRGWFYEADPKKMENMDDMSLRFMAYAHVTKWTKEARAESLESRDFQKAVRRAIKRVYPDEIDNEWKN